MFQIMFQHIHSTFHRHTASFCLFLLLFMNPAHAGNNQLVWENLERLVDKSWLMSAGTRPIQYTEYSYSSGNTITIEGMDEDGHIHAGKIAKMPDRSINMTKVRNGVVHQYKVTADHNSLYFTSRSDSLKHRYIYSIQDDNNILVFYEELRNHAWARIKRLDYYTVNEVMLDALAWIEIDPVYEREARLAREEALRESNSFGQRLSNALQDGVVSGVEEGVRERVRREIANEEDEYYH